MTVSDPSIVAYLAFGTSLATLATTILSYRKSVKNAVSIQEVHLSLNSRLDQLLEAKGLAAHAAGMAEEAAKKEITQ